MDVVTFATFVSAVTVLMLIPGPNVALITANSIANGVRHGLLTVCGTSAAMVLHLSITVAGMAAALEFLGLWFEWLRWAGVGYLIYIGLAAWRAQPSNAVASEASPVSGRNAIAGGFLVSLTNTKTLLFYGAFFPQFMETEGPANQPLILAAVFLGIAIMIDSLWAIAAARLRPLIRYGSRTGAKVAAVLYWLSGLGLALARRE